MKVHYTFATGEVSEIEVTEELGAEISDMEKTAGNKDRAETRRHFSMEDLAGQGLQFADTYDIVQHFMGTCEVEALRRAFQTLLPQQQELILKVFFQGESIESIARNEGVSGQAIGNRLRKALAKMKKILL